MNWKDELRKSGFPNSSDWVIEISIAESFIESLLKKERIEENEYWIGRTLNNENGYFCDWTINKMDFEKRNLELR